MSQRTRILLELRWKQEDYNGDGFTDLAISAHGEGILGVSDAGVVHILYGATGGLTAVGNQLWSLDYSPLIGEAQQHDGFGSSMGSGDFNGDGFIDLGIAIPAADSGGTEAAGAVSVIYGSSGGLIAQGNQYWHRGSYGIAGSSESTAFFGLRISTGDFDQDGYVDMAVSAPLADDNGLTAGFGISEHNQWQRKRLNLFQQSVYKPGYRSSARR